MTSADQLEAIAAIPAQRPSIVVECRSAPAGSAALRAAAALARERDAHVTVVASVPTAAECRTCSRLGAVSWPTVLQDEACEELLKAREELGEDIDAEYMVARGARTQVLLDSAAQARADVLIVAGRASRRLRARAACRVLGT